MPVAEIARKLSIRYQHAYKVCRDTGLLAPRTEKAGVAAKSNQLTRPKLTTAALKSRGFLEAGKWVADGARLTCPISLPSSSGVYAFSLLDEVMYVGLASRSLAQRLYFYGNPGVSQQTNIRLNGLIRDALIAGNNVAIHYACPPNFEWNGFRVSGPEGLEAGIIASYFLPWNVKGT